MGMLCREVPAAAVRAGLRDTAYEGGGPSFAETLACVAHGGQIVLSETSWGAVQEVFPGQSQVQMSMESNTSNLCIDLGLTRPRAVPWAYGCLQLYLCGCTASCNLRAINHVAVSGYV